MKKQKRDYTILLLGIAFILLAIFFWPKPIPAQPEYPLPNITNYSNYDCPPQLTQEQCHKRIDFCLVNNIDIEEYFLTVYNRLK